MGVVYRATDSTLKRQVAIKVLPASVAGDTDRLARFQREAEVLASLNHPNIAAIYGLEKTQDCTALVMELVDGEDLSQRIARGAIPIDEALPTAKQIAEALEAAHEQGIIHRDLKPANIKVRPDGTVKVLDFGLAKALDQGSGIGVQGSGGAANSPTITSPAMTMQGVILGTAAYMAPEQARGKFLDKRADIWSFGAVLFEMLSGTRAFGGDDVAETLANVINKEPAWDLLPVATPSAIKSLITRCLERDPKARLRDIGEARIQIARAGVAAPATPPSPAPATAAAPIWPRALPWAVAAALAVALAVSLSPSAQHQPGGAPLRRFTIEIPWELAANWNDFHAAISPDGAQVAYNCREGNTVSICGRALDGLTARPVAEGRDAFDWFFSPDGEWIGIADDVGLSRVSLRGGQPQQIVRWSDQEDQGRGTFTWTTDGHILFGSRSGIQRVLPSGGAPVPVTRVAAGSGVASHQQPSTLPGGQSALITVVDTTGRRTGAVANLADGSIRDLGIEGQNLTYVAPGYLVFLQGTTLLAAAFDPTSAAPIADPVPVLENVSRLGGVARDGTLVYKPTRGESTARLVWVTRDGRATPVAGDPLDYTHLDMAPDGRRALLNVEGQVDLIDLASGTRKVLSQGGMPVWTAHGDQATFRAANSLWWMPADGSAKPEVVVPQSGTGVATSWNAQTRELAYYDHIAYEIWIRTRDGKTRKFLGGPGRKRSGRFSPDGKWMAFVSDETGDYQVYVTAYPGPGPTVAVSTKGGLSPLWSANGRELFYRLGSKMMVATMSSTAPPGFGVPTELFDGPYTLDLRGHQREDVAPDGRFLMVENSDDYPIVIVQNWPAELARLVR